jgi:methylase of polypeptide subunit release factors
MKELVLENGIIYYDYDIDGGGSTFGINALKNDDVKLAIKSGNILEMCSGPGFMGFYLALNGKAKNLYLSDINSIHKKYINKTAKKNKLNNVHFIESNAFRYFNISIKFDTIIINPPHYSTRRLQGYKNQKEEFMCLDEDMKLHKEFLENAKYFLNDSGVIIIIGNMGGIKPEKIMEYAYKDYSGEIIACERFGWIRDSRFYVLKLTKNVY